MSALGESLRALSPQREAQFQFSASVRGGVVPDWREQFSGFFGDGGAAMRSEDAGTKGRHSQQSGLTPSPSFPAGQAQQDGPPQPPQVCPASSTQTPASPAKEFK